MRRLITVAGLFGGIASAGYFVSSSLAGGFHCNISKTGPGPLVVLVVPIVLTALAAKHAWAFRR
jgi:hypothetical protein